MAYPSPAESEMVYSTLPLWIVLIPLIGSFFVYRIGLKFPRRRDSGVLLITGLTLLLSILLFLQCTRGAVVELKLQAGFIDPLLTFKVDFLSATFTLLAALIWFLATLFSITYMQHEGEQDRYYLFYLLSLGSCLGVFLSGDLLSLFVFFEVMTFASYVLVVHARTDEADEAGRSYLFLGVIGGLLLLTAILLLFYYNGAVGLDPQLEALDRLGNMRYLLAALLLAGFGVKSGAVPLHIWLPKAHPVAPSPASALLSGIIIKTGAYGILRVLNIIFSPAHPETASWHTAEQLGLAMIWVGVATMFSAAFIALFQSNAKRILAYSSISQMGYILMGLGTCAYLGYHGAIGLSGAFYHIINHAFFKASLFMLVGAVYVRTHQLDLQKLGGLWRSFPVTTAAFLVAAAGITGIPGLNGYTSKTLLHHAIVEASAHGGASTLILAEKIFTVTSALTVCYIIKLFTGIFFGPRPAGLADLPRETASERIVFGLLSVAIITLGGFPSLIIQRIIIPAGASFTLDAYHLEHLAELNFWDHHDLQAIGLVLGLGLLLFLLLRRHLYRLQLPGWLSVEKLIYRPLIRTGAALFTGTSRAVETAVDSSYIYSPYALRAFTISGNLAETAVETILVKSLAPLREACGKVGSFDNEWLPWLGRNFQRLTVWVRDGIYNLWFNILGRLLRNFIQFLHKLFFMLIHMDFDPSGIRFYQTLNVSNLDFNLILMITFLLVLLSLFFLVN
ncbi:MAG: complex I subunit 5 family protein [Bacillota bacterium]